MTDRDRLIDLIVSANIFLFGSDKPYAEVYADHLIANGVTVGDANNATTTWISVEDRLPEDRELVLVWHTGYKTPKKAFHKDDLDTYLTIFRLDGDNGIDGEVTHWMPLPQPPKEVL